MRAALTEREGKLRYPIAVTFPACCASVTSGVKTRLALAGRRNHRRLSMGGRAEPHIQPRRLPRGEAWRWRAMSRGQAHRQGECERRALPKLAFDPDPAPVQL